MIFKNMAIILVKLNTENIQSLLRILRVKCMSCKSTHAVLLYSIVPYSQYALEVHLKALQSDFLNTFIDWIEWNEEINEYSYYYIRSQFHIVPYSQYALEVHLKALQSDFLNTFIDWIEWNEEINEYSYYYIRSQFQKDWKERLMSESMRLKTHLF